MSKELATGILRPFDCTIRKVQIGQDYTDEMNEKCLSLSKDDTYSGDLAGQGGMHPKMPKSLE